MALNPTEISSAVSGLSTTNHEGPNPQPSTALHVQSVGVPNNLFTYLSNHWTLIESLSWTSSAQPGTVLFARPITPAQSFPILEYLCQIYNTWSGNVNYRIQFVSTAFQGGKLACALLPPNFNPTTTNYTAQQLSIWPYELADVKNPTSMDMATGDMNQGKFHYFPGANDDPTATQFIGGWFVVYVVNTLVMSGTTAGAVTVQVSANAFGMVLDGIVPPRSITGVAFDRPYSIDNTYEVCRGDYYTGIALLSRTAYPTASLYLDGVRKGDRTFYTGRNLTIDPVNEIVVLGPVTSGEDHPVPMGGTVLPRMSYTFGDDKDALAWGHADTATLPLVYQLFNSTSSTVVCMGYGASAGTTNYLPFPCPLNATSVTTSFDFSSMAFTPLGDSPESFVTFLGSKKLMTVQGFDGFTHFPYWQCVGYEAPVRNGYALFGQIIDDETQRAICYYKYYFQGFMTTSAVSANTIIAKAVTFKPISLVDQHFPLPVATTEMMMSQLTMRSTEFRN